MTHRDYRWIDNTTVLRPFFRDHPGEPVPEENFWTLWCKGRLTEADTLKIQLGATPSGLTSAHLHHPPTFFCLQCFDTVGWAAGRHPAHKKYRWTDNKVQCNRWTPE